MNITITKIKNYTKITIEKERLDVASMKAVKDDIFAIIEEHNKIILDMSKVHFLDSSGLSVLISILKMLNKIDDATLTLCALQEQPSELMELTQLYNVFTIVESCDI